jgi:hypothetical protein
MLASVKKTIFRDILNWPYTTGSGSASGSRSTIFMFSDFLDPAPDSFFRVMDPDPNTDTDCFILKQK